MVLRNNMKRFSLVLILLIMLPLYANAAPQAPNISADSFILVDSKRGQVLYQKISSERTHVSIASKIMTVLIAIEKSKLDSKVTISKESVKSEGANLNLVVGEKYTISDLLTAVMLSPANDASNAVAEFVGGDIENFINLMNNKAKDLNMKNTRFTNPSGLYDPVQFTTAEDIAIMMRYALSNPIFNNIFSFNAKTWESGGKTQVLVNSNTLFWSYDGVDGGKAGYNDKKQQAAITTATREGTRLICIVLDSPENSVFDDSIKLFDYGFSNYKTDILVRKGQALKSIAVAEQMINLISYNDVYYTFPIGDNYIKSFELIVSDKLSLPITKESLLGSAKYVLKDETVVDVDLHSDREIYPPSDIFKKISDKMAENRDIYMLLIFLVALEVILIILALTKFILRLIKRTKKLNN
ncbi:MAG: D-alanyl-D-alanine carboxypeptidase [Clostridiales bacterium]|jgi:D-alanyl-D-alanine carboxypeptidase/D-alanyl-D-alanine carboxypeptidase (penicillin-binding protein 5/6)|nr:D-alanyl-D-alanine carboxypeptidase [Clostridiales bacterium]